MFETMQVAVAPRASHPLLAALAAHVDQFEALAQTPLFALTPDDLTALMTLLSRHTAQLAEVELRAAHQAAAVDVDVKTAWVRGTHQRPAVATRRLTLAAAVDSREPVRAAMAAGAVTEAQAEVIVRALDQLPDDLAAEQRVGAETFLIDAAGDHHPGELQILGRKLLDVVAPDIAEAQAARLVDAEYRRATEACRLSLADRHDGTWQIHGVLPAAHAHILDKLLTAWGSPKHRRATEGPGIARRPSPERRGRAFCELLERIPTDLIPYAGGVSARVVVDIGYDDLTARLSEAGVATLDGVVDVPAWVARRMACEAGIMPVVLGGQGELLDLGRSKRFHNEPQRIGIFRRDRTCRAEACDWPAWMGHVHHPTPWSRGGKTDMTGMALCPHHHARAHDPTYEMHPSKNGKVVFQRT